MRWRRRLLSRQRRAAGKVRETPTRKVHYAQPLYPPGADTFASRIGKSDVEKGVDALFAEAERRQEGFAVGAIDVEVALSPKRPNPGGSGRVKRGG